MIQPEQLLSLIYEYQAANPGTTLAAAAQAVRRDLRRAHQYIKSISDRRRWRLEEAEITAEDAEIDRVYAETVAAEEADKAKG